MKCEFCDGNLYIGKSELTTAVDSLDIYSEVELVCTNANCSNYGGLDLKKPKKSKKLKSKVN